MPLPNDQEQRVKTRDLSWREMCQKSWGKDWNEPEVVYEFHGREFKSTDRTDSGIYEREE